MRALLLLESGGHLLLEDGVSRLVLEPDGRDLWGLLASPLAVLNLRAAVATYNLRAAPVSFNLQAAVPTYNLGAAVATVFYRKAAAGAVFNLRAATVSITQNLTWFRGEDVTLNFAMQPPQDVSGWHLTLTVKDTLGGSTQFSKSATIDDAGRGTFHFAIASADTSGLSAGRYVWDVRRTDTGSKSTVADGYLDLRQEVTA